MNVFTLLMLFFAVIGLIDKLVDDRCGLSSEFDKGLATMGPTLFSMAGFYCISISVLNLYSDTIVQFFSMIHLKPEIVFGMLLAPDLGGYNIAVKLSSDPVLAVFSGVLLTSTIGATISFQFPVFLGSIHKKDIPFFMKGIIYGLIVLPFILLAVGYGIGIKNMVVTFLPIFIVCFLLIGGMFFAYKVTMKIVTTFGLFIHKLSIILFIFVLGTIYFNMKLTSIDLIKEITYTGLQMTITVCGAMVLCHLLQKYAQKYLKKITHVLNINEYATIGLVLSLGSSVAMLPLFHKMDEKGKIINSAFSVSGAYVFGGQYAFISSFVSAKVSLLYILTKLIAGIFAVIIASVMLNKKKKLDIIKTRNEECKLCVELKDDL